MTVNTKYLPPWAGGSKNALLMLLRTTLTVALFLIAGIVTTNGQSPTLSADAVTTNAPQPAPAPAEVPPTPKHWFNDYTKATSPIFAIELDRRLEKFERETTHRFLVVVLAKLPPGAALDDYCLRAFNAWGVGQKGVHNGAVLFVFVDDHKVRIEVGRGLEQPLTNPACQQIVAQMLPAFRRGDFEEGITTGVSAMVKIIQGQPAPTHAAP